MLKGIEKPRYRSAARLFAGRLYYSLTRYAYWCLGGLRFAKRADNELAYSHFTHGTPLLRKLKDVDMYLQYNKITNLGIAVKRVDRVVIRPGETFSYWKLIGKPSRIKGYKKGLVLRNGRMGAGTGGGLCQLSNLIYWMTLHTSLTVIERHRHGYDVFPDAGRTQPFGSGATCFYNFGDLMIRNDTEQSFQLRVGLMEDTLEGQWLSDKPRLYTYEVYEDGHCFRQELWGGYTRNNVIRRRVLDASGTLLNDEYIAENHAITMYPPMLGEGSGRV